VSNDPSSGKAGTLWRRASKKPKRQPKLLGGKHISVPKVGVTGSVSDGMEAIPRLLAVYRMSSGRTREEIGDTLKLLRLMFNHLAPLAHCGELWGELMKLVEEQLRM
jgi:hypothetical protein